MEKVEAYLSIEVFVECPYCDGYFDLLNNDDFPGLNEDGGVLNYACPSEGHWIDSQREYEETVECPDCKKDFKVEGIGW